MARPLNYDPKIGDSICALLVEGQSLRKITADPKMPGATTVFKWLRDNEDFAKQYAHAREAQADTLADEIVDIADGEETTADPQRDKLRVDARKWVAAKLKPKKYGDKIDVTSGDKALNEMNETAVAARIASLLKTGLERDGAR